MPREVGVSDGLKWRAGFQNLRSEMRSGGRNGQLLLQIDQDLLVHFEQTFMGSVEVDNQEHDRRKGEDERSGDKVVALAGEAGQVPDRGHRQDRHEIKGVNYDRRNAASQT